MGVSTGGVRTTRPRRTTAIYGLKASAPRDPQPRNSKKQKTNTAINGNSSNNTTVANVPTSNEFDALSNLREDDEDMGENTEVHATRRQRAPPIVIIDSNPSLVQSTMNELLPSKKFELRLMTIGIRVNVPDYDDYVKAHAGLKKANFKFYTYHTADTRPVKIVLYGLTDVDSQEVNAALNDNGVVPDDIKKLNIKKPLFKDQAIYLLYFKHGSVKLSDLRKIKHLNNLIVRWEKYHPKQYDKVAQCRNCQRLGHSSINCHLPPRCLVCAEEHRTDDCPKKRSRHQLNEARNNNVTIDKSYVKCALCNQNHTANYAGCEKRKEFIDLQQSRTRRRPNARSQPDILLNSNVHFPQPAWSQQRNPVTSTQPISGSYADALRCPPAQADLMMQLIASMKEMLTGMQQMMSKMTEVMCAFMQHTSSR